MALGGAVAAFYLDVFAVELGLAAAGGLALVGQGVAGG